MPGWLAMIWKPLFALRCLLYRAFGNGDDASFHAAFANEFKGVDASDANLEAMATDAYELCNATVFPEAANTMKMLKYDGYKVVLVTESPEFLVKPLAKALGASRVIGGVLEKETRADGAVVFTGKLTGPPVVGEEKARAALRFAEEVGVNMKKSIAYGDGLGDAALMRACGKAYAVSPSVELRREAEANWWNVLSWREDAVMTEAGNGENVAAARAALDYSGFGGAPMPGVDGVVSYATSGAATTAAAGGASKAWTMVDPDQFDEEVNAGRRLA